MIIFFAVFLAFVLFLVLTWYLTVLRKDLQIEIFRQNLFKLRDELFDKAADGLIDFNSDAYGMARTAINGFIRFSEDLTLSKLLIESFAYKRSKHRKGYTERYKKNLASAKSKLNPYQREVFDETFHRMHLYLAFYLIKSSLVLSILLYLIRLKNGFKKSAFRVALSYMQPSHFEGRFGTLDAEVSLSESGIATL